MNTLHLCHWSGKDSFKNHSCMPLLGKYDSLSIYGALKSEDAKWLAHYLKDFEHQWYVVNQSSCQYSTDFKINHNVITTNQWLALIIEHKNTLTWK